MNLSEEEERLVMNETLLSTSFPNLTEGHHNNNNGTDGYNNGDDEGALYEVPVSIVVLLSLLYGAISVAALIGNILVLWVVSVSRRMRTVTNMFIANLAFADIIIGLFAIPFQFQAALLQRWDLPDFMCAFCPFVQVLSVNVSVFTLSAIAVDRYRAVLYPLSARASKRKAGFAIVAIWTVGVVLALPMEIDFKVVAKIEKGVVKPFCQNVGMSDDLRRYYILCLVIIQYLLPLIIITGAYIRMAAQLWGATAPGNKEESRDAVVLRNKKKVIKMLAVVVLLFALCWLPLQMYNFFGSFVASINEYQYINIIWFGFHWLAMSNSCCNPLIYAIFNDKFQREFKARLHCFQKCRGNRADSPCTEMSDFDRSRVRASYRFTEGRNPRAILTSNASHRGHRSRRGPNNGSAVSMGRNGVKSSSSECRSQLQTQLLELPPLSPPPPPPAEANSSQTVVVDIPNCKAEFQNHDEEEVDLITNLTTL